MKRMNANAILRHLLPAIVTVLIPIGAKAQYTVSAFNFPDANLRAWLKDYMEANLTANTDYDYNNGTIRFKSGKVGLITSINIDASTYPIANLNGIAVFTNLTSITITNGNSDGLVTMGGGGGKDANGNFNGYNGNPVAANTLDLSPFSKLTTVNIAGSNFTSISLPSSVVTLNLTSRHRLNSLNVSGCSNLVTLVATSGTNTFTSVTLPTEKTKLQTLKIGKNGITGTFNVSAYTSLKTFNFTSAANATGVTARIPSLTSVSLNNCAALTTVDLGTSGISSLNSNSSNTSLSTVTSLILDGCSNLTSLTLLENLTNLQKLNLSGCTNITNVDLSHTSSITNLNLQDCAELTSLKLGGNSLAVGDELNTNWSHLWLNGESGTGFCYPKLEHLEINGSTRLHTLPINRLSALKTLVFTNNSAMTEGLTLTSLHGLTTLNMSNNTFTHTTEEISLNARVKNLVNVTIANNTGLEHIDIGDAGMTTLDLSSNPDLISIKADAAPNLKTLNVNSLTKLQTLHCYNASSLENLNVTTNTALVDLWCANSPLHTLDVTHCTNLERFICAVCALNALDLTHCTKLKHLECHNNLGAAANQQNFSIDVSHCPDLEYISCQGMRNITSLDLTNLTKLHYLQAHYCGMSNLDLSHNPMLTYLQLDHNYFKEIDVTHNTALDTLRVENNKLHTLDLSHNTALTMLRLQNQYINALDLTGVNSITDFNGNNNGRNIRCEKSAWTHRDANNNVVTNYIYYLRLDDTEDGTTENIVDKTSPVLTAMNVNTTLEDDEFNLERVSWNNGTEYTGTRQNAPARKGSSNPADHLDQLEGKILFLALDDMPSRITYDYNTNSSSSAADNATFYLDLIDPGVVTGIEVVLQEQADAFTQLIAKGGHGCISIDSPAQLNVAIVNLNGQVVKTVRLNAGENQIDLPRGIYIVAGNKVAVN